MLVAVTDHAVERYRQRIAGSLDARTEIAGRVLRAIEAGRASDEPPAGRLGAPRLAVRPRHRGPRPRLRLPARPAASSSS